MYSILKSIVPDKMAVATVSLLKSVFQHLFMMFFEVLALLVLPAFFLIASPKGLTRFLL
jgi:hypothetical protein